MKVYFLLNKQYCTYLIDGMRIYIALSDAGVEDNEVGFVHCQHHMCIGDKECQITNADRCTQFVTLIYTI